jgi:tryptophan synthase alpha chain
MTAKRIEQCLKNASSHGNSALIGYLVGGYPDKETFRSHLIEVSQVVDVVEVGIPFSDPLADGLSIQKASAIALQQGVHLEGLLHLIASIRSEVKAPVVLMSYVNPLLCFGFQRLAEQCDESGISGLIVPDLPYEESTPLRQALRPYDLALIPLVTPVTPPLRRQMLCQSARGFVYAVTRTGVTGGHARLNASMGNYLRETRGASPVPVLAGFGVRTAHQVQSVREHCHGSIVGTALVECVERGESLSHFLSSLRPTPTGGVL